MHKGCREMGRKPIYVSLPTHSTTDLVNSLYYNKYIANTKHMLLTHTLYTALYILSIYVLLLYVRVRQ